MSNNLEEGLLLVGAGKMALEYAKVLEQLETPFNVIGRGEESAKSFAKATGILPRLGGVAAWLANKQHIASTAIVAVNVEELASTVIFLLEKGVKRILVEKPAGLNAAEIKKVAEKAEEKAAEVYVAYNRRFYAATRKAMELIKADGGITSFRFDFTEWSNVIEDNNNITETVKANWFLANSTHVVDLAFFLGGKPRTINCLKTGDLPWHPAASIFAGAGMTENGALFSYQANWQAPGRWQVELFTKQHRIIICPLEELYLQNLNSLKIERVPLDDSLDRGVKPGVYQQTLAFLSAKKSIGLLSIGEQAELAAKIYSKIAY